MKEQNSYGIDEAKNVLEDMNKHIINLNSQTSNLKSTRRKLKTIEMHRLSVDEFKVADKLPLIVVLDNVRSLYNVGSVFRTADAFRVKAIYLCGVTGCPPNAEIHKTALGGEDSVDWKYFERTEDAVKELHDKGFFVWSVEQVEGSTKLGKDSCVTTKNGNQNSQPSILNSQSSAVIFGNEVKGVQQSVVDMSDGCLEIPQFGTKHSLNVSITAGIVIWEFAKQRFAKE